ncbi:hypothetical protein R3P38DRAFT_2813641 [Favolaschia claudopus]|uniref:Uncharacterized protein n=1 Tax=Favolaschia claudopus TaxID=2862362 RepID=A0AAV9Z4V2_9AGAR
MRADPKRDEVTVEVTDDVAWLNSPTFKDALKKLHILTFAGRLKIIARRLAKGLKANAPWILSNANVNAAGLEVGGVYGDSFDCFIVNYKKAFPRFAKGPGLPIENELLNIIKRTDRKSGKINFCDVWDEVEDFLVTQSVLEVYDQWVKESRGRLGHEGISHPKPSTSWRAEMSSGTCGLAQKVPIRGDESAGCLDEEPSVTPVWWKRMLPRYRRKELVPGIRRPGPELEASKLQDPNS